MNPFKNVLPVAWVFCLFLFAVIGNCQETDEREEIIQFLTVEVQNELKEIFAVRLSVLADSQTDFFQLNESQVRKLKVAQKAVTKNLCDSFDHDLLSRTLDSILQPNIGPTFLINGRKCTLPNEKESDKVSKIILGFDGEEVTILGLSNNVANASSFIINRFDFREEPLWRKALGNLGDEDLSKFIDHQESLVRSRFTEFVVSTITYHLMTSKEQKASLRDWVNEKAEFDASKNAFKNARKFLSETKDLPDCLSDVQKDAWPTMIRKIRN